MIQIIGVLLIWRQFNYICHHLLNESKFKNDALHFRHVNANKCVLGNTQGLKKDDKMQVFKILNKDEEKES